MARAMSSETARVRDAIQNVLHTSATPLSARQVYNHYEVSSLGVSPSRVSVELAYMVRAKRVPVERIRAPHGAHLWAYYDPRVCTPLERQVRKPVDASKDVSLALNPIDMDELTGVNPGAEPVVDIPPGVKAVAIRVAGVSIRIELTD